jgi:methylated-DNA-[protein]-cysteine S-methyltransferase
MFATIIQSPVGLLQLQSDGRAITGVSLEASPGRGLPGQPHALLDRAAEQLQAYFAGELTQFDLPLHLEGTPFQESVWEALRSIPYGETISYAELAQRVGRPTAIRAVGTANGRNPISIIVPCHRVINTGGGLGGYSGGLPHKRTLLDLEFQNGGRVE